MASAMNWIKKLLPSCEEVSELTSQGLDEDLPLGKRLSRAMHLKMCVWCQRNAKQLKFMNKMARLKRQSPQQKASLSAAARDRISKALEQSNDQS